MFIEASELVTFGWPTIIYALPKTHNEECPCSSVLASTDCYTNERPSWLSEIEFATATSNKSQRHFPICRAKTVSKIQKQFGQDVI